MCVLAIMDDPEMAGVERDTYNDGPLVPSGSTLCKACLVKGSRYPHCVPTLQDRQLSVPGSSASTPSAQAAAPREAPTRTLTAPRRSRYGLMVIAFRHFKTDNCPCLVLELLRLLLKLLQLVRLLPGR